MPFELCVFHLSDDRFDSDVFFPDVVVDASLAKSSACEPGGIVVMIDRCDRCGVGPLGLDMAERSRPTLGTAHEG